jgi:hypothetical protein
MVLTDVTHICGLQVVPTADLPLVDDKGNIKVAPQANPGTVTFF